MKRSQLIIGFLGLLLAVGGLIGSSWRKGTQLDYLFKNATHLRSNSEDIVSRVNRGDDQQLTGMPQYLLQNRYGGRLLENSKHLRELRMVEIASQLRQHEISQRDIDSVMPILTDIQTIVPQALDELRRILQIRGGRSFNYHSNKRDLAELLDRIHQNRILLIRTINERLFNAIEKGIESLIRAFDHIYQLTDQPQEQEVVSPIEPIRVVSPTEPRREVAAEPGMLSSFMGTVGSGLGRVRSTLGGWWNSLRGTVGCDPETDSACVPIDHAALLVRYMQSLRANASRILREVQFGYSHRTVQSIPDDLIPQIMASIEQFATLLKMLRADSSENENLSAIVDFIYRVLHLVGEILQNRHISSSNFQQLESIRQEFRDPLDIRVLTPSQQHSLNRGLSDLSRVIDFLSPPVDVEFARPEESLYPDLSSLFMGESGDVGIPEPGSDVHLVTPPELPPVDPSILSSGRSVQPSAPSLNVEGTVSPRVRRYRRFPQVMRHIERNAESIISSLFLQSGKFTLPPGLSANIRKTEEEIETLILNPERTEPSFSDENTKEALRVLLNAFQGINELLKNNETMAVTIRENISRLDSYITLLMQHAELRPRNPENSSLILEGIRNLLSVFQRAEELISQSRSRPWEGVEEVSGVRIDPRPSVLKLPQTARRTIRGRGRGSGRGIRPARAVVGSSSGAERGDPSGRPRRAAVTPGGHIGQTRLGRRTSEPSSSGEGITRRELQSLDSAVGELVRAIYIINNARENSTHDRLDIAPETLTLLESGIDGLEAHLGRLTGEMRDIFSAIKEASEKIREYLGWSLNRVDELGVVDHNRKRLIYPYSRLSSDSERMRALFGDASLYQHVDQLFKNLMGAFEHIINIRRDALARERRAAAPSPVVPDTVSRVSGSPAPRERRGPSLEDVMRHIGKNAESAKKVIIKFGASSSHFILPDDLLRNLQRTQQEIRDLRSYSQGSMHIITFNSLAKFYQAIEAIRSLLESPPTRALKDRLEANRAQLREFLSEEEVQERDWPYARDHSTEQNLVVQNLELMISVFDHISKLIKKLPPGPQPAVRRD